MAKAAGGRERIIVAGPRDRVIRVQTELGDINVFVNLMSGDESESLVVVKPAIVATLLDKRVSVKVEDGSIMLSRDETTPGDDSIKWVDKSVTSEPAATRKPGKPKPLATPPPGAE